MTSLFSELNQTREKPRGEVHHACVALKLFDPHQGEVATGVAPPQAG